MLCFDGQTILENILELADIPIAWLPDHPCTFQDKFPTMWWSVSNTLGDMAALINGNVYLDLAWLTF